MLQHIHARSWVDVVNTASVEYHVAHDAGEYEAALQRLEAFLDRVRPELVMYQAGMDPYEHDPVGSIDGVDEEFLRRRDALIVGAVRSRGIPLVVNLAGGYGDIAERLHLMTIRVMANWRASSALPSQHGAGAAERFRR